MMLIVVRMVLPHRVYRGSHKEYSFFLRGVICSFGGFFLCSCRVAPEIPGLSRQNVAKRCKLWMFFCLFLDSSSCATRSLLQTELSGDAPPSSIQMCYPTHLSCSPVSWRESRQLSLTHNQTMDWQKLKSPAQQSRFIRNTLGVWKMPLWSWRYCQSHCQKLCRACAIEILALLWPLFFQHTLPKCNGLESIESIWLLFKYGFWSE